MFGDFERQAIFLEDPTDAIGRVLARAKGVARFKLRRNCRNTPRVAEYIVRLGGLKPAYSRVLRPDWGHDGTPRTLFYTSRDDQMRLLREAVDELLAAGELSPEDIVILSPVRDSCAHALSQRNSAPAFKALPARREGVCSYGTIGAFKGLEAPAVILTDIEEVGTERAQRLFYVGVSRATDRLGVLARQGLQGAIAQLITHGGSNVGIS